MEFGAAFGDHEAEAGAADLADVAGALERLEEAAGMPMPLSAMRNVRVCGAVFSTVRCAGDPFRRIFGGIGEKIGEDVPQERFVGQDGFREIVCECQA